MTDECVIAYTNYRHGSSCKRSGIFVAFFAGTSTSEEDVEVAVLEKFVKELLRCFTRGGMKGRRIEVFKWLYLCEGGTLKGEKKAQKHQEKLIGSLQCIGGTHRFYFATQRGVLAKKAARPHRVIQRTSTLYLSLHKVTSPHHLPFGPLASRIHEDNKMAKDFSISPAWRLCLAHVLCECEYMKLERLWCKLITLQKH